MMYCVTCASRRAILGAALFMALPALVFANAGTPLMWFQGFHLFVGNLVIGILEGLLISRIFKSPGWKAVGCMIGANYFSMVVGLFLVTKASRFLLWCAPANAMLYWIPFFVVLLALGAYLLTVLLEWPFCRWALGPDRRTWRRALRASLLAQTASYLLLVPFYIVPSSASFFTRTKLVHSLDFAKDKKAVIYYLGESDGDLYRIRLDGRPAEKIMPLAAHGPNDRLFTRRGENGRGWDLWWFVDHPEWYLADHPAGRFEYKKLIDNFAPAAAVDPVTRPARSGRETPPGLERKTWFNFGEAADLRPENQRDWTARTGFWAIEGLQATNEKTGEKFHLALETPLIQCFARNMTILPGDQAVFQLSGWVSQNNQIVLLDLNTRQLAQVALGRGPLVGLEP